MDLDSLRLDLEVYISCNLSKYFRDPHVGTIRELEEQGGESSLYWFELTHRQVHNEKSTELVIKIYNGLNSEVFFDSSLSARREYQISNEVSLHGIPVPKVYAYEPENNDIMEYAFVIMKKLDGIPLYRYILEREDKIEIGKIWRKHATLLNDIHQLPPEDFLKYFEQDFLSEDEFLKHDLDLWYDLVRPHEIHKKYESIFLWLYDQVDSIPIQNYSLIHRDYYLGNLFCTNSGDLLVLDWGISYVTDFRLALGYTLMRIRIDRNATIERDEYLHLYEQIGKIKVENILFFEILALIKDLMIMTILKFHNKSNYNNFSQFIPHNLSYRCLLDLSYQSYPDLNKKLKELI